MCFPKLGIIGCGLMGSIHARNFFQQGCVITALYDSCRDRAEQLKQRFGFDAMICPSLEEALDQVDAVVIAVPPNATPDVVATVAHASKPMYIEKPPGISLSAAEFLCAAIRRSRVVADFGFQYDLDSGAIWLQELIGSGHLGDVRLLHFAHHNEDNSGNNEHTRRIVGQLAVETPMIDSGIHRTRLLLRWFGPGEIMDVNGLGVRTDPTLPQANAQSGWLVTRHACGIVTTYISITWFAPGARKPQLAFHVGSPLHPFWIIIGTKRTVFWLPRKRQVWLCGPDRDDPEIVEFPYEDLYLLKAQHFIKCLRGEASPTCPPEAARSALALTLALDRATRGSTSNKSGL